jgi:hypothetical protein
MQRVMLAWSYHARVSTRCSESKHDINIAIQLTPELKSVHEQRHYGKSCDTAVVCAGMSKQVGRGRL